MFRLQRPLAIALGLVGAAMLVGLALLLIVPWTSHQPRSAAPASPANAAPPEPAEKETGEEPEDMPVPVKTIRPHRDLNFKATIEQPAYVEAYYHDDLRARASGPVKYIMAAIGDKVTRDQTLVVIDEPDVAQEVMQKAAVIKQREREKSLAEANVRAAELTVREKESYLAAKDAWREFKLMEYERFRKLAMPPNPAVTMDVVDERWKDYLVAKAEKTASEAAVDKAKSDVAIAKADVDLKDAMIKVAEEDQKRTQEILNLATIKAPFDGIVTRRNADPGSFVQNASTGTGGEPLLRVERTDIVTIYARIPDTYAPYVTPDAEAIIQMSDPHGFMFRIHAKVTRISRSLQTPEKDRTISAARSRPRKKIEPCAWRSTSTTAARRSIRSSWRGRRPRTRPT
jgi:multidrug resistance efflux pump